MSSWVSTNRPGVEISSDGSERIDGAALVKAIEAAGLHAYIEMTGGGTATIYVTDAPAFKFSEEDGRILGQHGYGASVGPGVYYEEGGPKFYGEELTWGVDAEDGEFAHWERDGECTVAAIAESIASMLQGR